jgi:hypothetical protein
MRAFIFSIFAASCLLLSACACKKNISEQFPPQGGYSETNNIYFSDKDLVISFPSPPHQHVIASLVAARAIQESPTRWRMKNPDLTNKTVLDALALCNEYKATLSNE